MRPAAATVFFFVFYTQMTKILADLAPFAFVAINALLLLSYYVIGVQRSDWGETPQNMKFYMLFAASLAYLFNLYQSYIMYKRGAIEHFVPLIIYYILQLFFIPLVRFGDKCLVKLLLYTASIPIAYLVLLSKGKMELFLSVFQLIHVFFNDFILYGFLH